MENKQTRRGLGRGLSALMSDIAVPSAPAAADSVRRSDIKVPVERVHPNPDQPRREFDPEALGELAASIRQKGIIQPLVVRQKPGAAEGEFEIVAGERRWRAAQMAGQHSVPVVVRDFDDVEVLEIAIIENIQRADLNAIEEARGYRMLMDRFGHTQEKIAEALTKSRSHIANMLRLLNLPGEVQQMVRDGKLSAGHARALVTRDDSVSLAKMAVDKGLSVREMEKIASKQKGTAAPRAIRAEKDADTRALEQDLAANLKMGVTINHAPSGAGELVIKYRDLNDLDLLCQVLATMHRDYAPE